MPINPEIPLSVQPLKVNLLEPMQQAQQLQAQHQQLNALQMENQQRALDMQDQQNLRRAWMEAGGDINGTLTKAVQYGASPKAVTAFQQSVIGMQKSLAEKEKLEQDLTKNKLDMYQGGAQPILDEQDPAKQQALWDTHERLMASRGIIKPQDITPYPGPEGVKAHFALSTTLSQALAKQKAEAATTTAGAKQTQANVAELKAPYEMANLAAGAEAKQAEIPGYTAGARAKGLEADILQKKLDLMKGTSSPVDWMKLVDDVVPAGTNRHLNFSTKQRVSASLSMGDPNDPGGLQGAKRAIEDAAQQVGHFELATDPRVQANKISVAVQTAAARNALGGATEQDYADAGEMYMRTGNMPSIGQGSIGKQKVMHYGQQWARENGMSPKDLVVMQAAYKGSADSLKKFQAQRDQIVSFEQTAQKNLDMMVQLGQKLVDSGSPALNKPLRAINRSALGSDEQAAFDAAQLIAQNEVAKVTSGGGLGGVVSDSAKEEMKKAMGESPTIGNMIAVAKILRQDMANRHESMDNTLADIKSKIGGGGPVPVGTAAPPTPSQAAPARIPVISPEGTPGFIDADKWDAAQKRGFKKR